MASFVDEQKEKFDRLKSMGFSDEEIVEASDEVLADGVKDVEEPVVDTSPTPTTTNDKGIYEPSTIGYDSYEAPRSAVWDALYSSNTLFASGANNFSENNPGLQVNKLRVENEKASGYKFSYTNPDIQEIVKTLDQNVIDNLGHYDSKEEFLTSINRIKEQNEALAHLHEEFGAVGTFASMIPGAIFDWDSLVGASLVTKTKKALDMANVVDGIKRAGAYSLAGGTTALASDAVYQEVMGTDNDTQRLMAFLGGSVLSTVASKTLLDYTPNQQRANMRIETPDGTFRQVTPEEMATVTPDEDGVLRTANGDRVRSQSIASDIEDDLELVEEVVVPEMIAQASRGNVKLNWLEEKLIWTPGTRLHASENPYLNGIAQRILAPYKAIKDADGNLVPTRPNAMFHKQQYERHWNETLTQLNRDHMEAVRQGYQGNIQEYLKEVDTHYVKSTSTALRQELDRIPDTLRGVELETAIQEAYTRARVNFQAENPHIGRSADIISKYYDTIGKEAQGLGTKGFDGVIFNRTYRPRSWNAEKIKANETQAIERIAQAIMNHPANKALSVDEVMDMAKGVVANVESRGVLKEMIDKAGGQVEGSRQKQRTLNLLDDEVHDLLNNDVMELGSAYSYSMSGRLALQKNFGASTAGELENFYKDLSKIEGVESKDMDDVKALIDTLLGTREVMKNPTSLANKSTRILTKANGIIYGPGFAPIALAEIGNVIATTGFRATLGTYFSSISDAFRMAKGTELKTEWLNELRSAGLIGDIIAGKHMQRYDMTDSISSSGAVEKYLDLGVHFVTNKLGLAHVTEGARGIALGAGFNYLTQLSRKPALSSVEKSRLARIGLSEDDLAQVKQLVDNGVVKYDASGNLKSFNFDEWDIELTDKIQGALFNHMESTILHPNGATLPLFVSDPNSPIAKIMLQFMRFPIAMHEQLALRGYSESDINTLIGLVTNMALFSIVAQVKDMGKPEDKQRYNLDTDEGWENTFEYIMTNNFMTGSFATGAEKILTLLTGKVPHSSYTPGTSGVLGVSQSTYSSGQKAINLLTEGEVRDAFATMQNPLWKLMVVGPILQELVRGE